jgi:hypothetical protein
MELDEHDLPACPFNGRDQGGHQGRFAAPVAADNLTPPSVPAEPLD